MTQSEISSDDYLKKIRGQSKKDRWEDNKFKGLVNMNIRQKGKFGELYGRDRMISLNHSVTKRTSSGHDYIIDGHKTEIKFGLCTKLDNSCIMNHISLKKDWDRILFIVFNKTEENNRFLWFTKEDFLKLERNDNNLFKRLFSPQQGGKNIKNDDYMCTNIPLLLYQSFVHELSDWEIHHSPLDEHFKK